MPAGRLVVAESQKGGERIGQASSVQTTKHDVHVLPTVADWAGLPLPQLANGSSLVSRPLCAPNPHWEPLEIQQRAGRRGAVGRCFTGAPEGRLPVEPVQTDEVRSTSYSSAQPTHSMPCTPPDSSRNTAYVVRLLPRSVIRTCHAEYEVQRNVYLEKTTGRRERSVENMPAVTTPSATYDSGRREWLQGVVCNPGWKPHTSTSTKTASHSPTGICRPCSSVSSLIRIRSFPQQKKGCSSMRAALGKKKNKDHEERRLGKG